MTSALQNTLKKASGERHSEGKEKTEQGKNSIMAVYFRQIRSLERGRERGSSHMCGVAIETDGRVRFIMGWQAVGHPTADAVCRVKASVTSLKESGAMNNRVSLNTSLHMSTTDQITVT